MTPPTPISGIVERFAGGEVLLLPTDTLYGLHARFDRPEAIERVRRIKGLPKEKPLIHLATPELLPILGVTLPKRVVSFLGEIWPAPITFILPCASPGGTIAVRWPDHPLWHDLFTAGLPPVVSTSANRSGASPPVHLKDLDPGMREEVDFILPGEPAPPGRPSTLVDLSVDPPRIVRKGAATFPQNLWKNLWKNL